MTKQNLVDILKNESESAHVVYAEFMLNYKNTNDSVFCFYEGYEDKKYYNFRIKQKLSCEPVNFTCYGRDNVFIIHDLIKKQKAYQKARTLFFVDKDYHPLAIHENIYCLPCYSIENLYTSHDSLKRILKNEFELKENESDYLKTMELFEILQQKFHSELTFFNSWLACQSDIRIKRKENTYLKIDDQIKSFFESIVKIDLNNIADFSDLQDINKLQLLFPYAPIVEEQKLNEKITYFNSVDKQMYFRGKFEIKFFVSFLSRLQSEICKKRSEIFEKKRNCNLRFEVHTSISVLSQYATDPQCLFYYLNKFI